MKRLPGRLIPLGLLFCAISVLAQDTPRKLLLGSPIERELAAAQTHSYTIELKPNQIVRIAASQRGIDLALAVISPEHKKLFDIDSPTGAQGDERATIFAAQGGVYGIDIRSLDRKAPAGKYEIRIEGFITESEYNIEKLAALARLWGAVRYFHPSLAYKDVDWDEALIKVIPLVKASRTPDDYREAIQTLLATLNDPATIVERRLIASAAPASIASENTGVKEPVLFRVVDGFLVVNAVDWVRALVSSGGAAFSRQPQMMQEAAKARGVLVDCRFGSVAASQAPPFYLQRYLDNVLPELVQGVVSLGTDRYRVHNGYPPQRGNTSGGYISSLVTEVPGAINGLAQSKKPLAFIIDEKTPDMVSLLSGLQASGAKIVQVGSGTRSQGGRFHQIPLVDGVRVRMRVTEFVHPNGGSTFQPDAQAPSDATTDDKIISSAISVLSSPADVKAPSAAGPAPIAMRNAKDATYPQMSFPSEEYRLLALFRFWNVINYFFPYKNLTDKPWNTVLTEFIPRFLENKTALDYEMTVAEMVARIQDTHGFVGGFKSLNMHLGNSAPPIILGSAGGKLVVTGIIEQAVADAAGIKIGDVIVAIDGESTEQRIAYLSKFKALSTQQSAYGYIYPLALRGAADSKVKLQIEGADRQTRVIEVARSVTLDKIAPVERKTPIYEILPSGYGYIDLARLPLADAQKALDSLINTPAIIFDMRGYPNGTAWELAPRLTEKKNVTAARFRRPFQSATSLGAEDFGGETPDFSFDQKLPSPKGAIYKGKVVMLINHDAISQAEHTCMFFESAADVTFIGSPTNGANGDVTNLVLPGALYVSFSGHDVRHADGRQLQRVGIQPHIKVEPTIDGIRDGRDEILQAAVKFLNSTAKK